MYLVAAVATSPDNNTIGTAADSHQPLASTLSDLAGHDDLLDAAVDAIVGIDQKGLIIRFNKTAEAMFGYPASAVVGKPVHILLGPGQLQNHEDFISGTRRIIGRSFEIMARRSNGSLFPASLSVGEARSPLGLRFIGLIHDLTSQKQAEEEALRHREELMHASRLTTMGEIAAAMAHELNQPLSAIATYTAACQRLLMQGDGSRDEVMAALKEIGAQAHRSGEVIQRIRDYTRGRATPHKFVDLEALIEEIRPLSELYAKANNVRLMIDVDTKLPPINADGMQIQQVILNLLRNGVDAMVDTAAAQRNLRLHAYAISNKQIRVDIIDHGHGVPEAVRSRLFTPLFTTKDAGMGMGLAISRSLITSHGGKLDCYNNPEGGATFFFTLLTAVEQ